MIYLDHAATTPVDPEVLKTMLPYLSEKFGNASTLYDLGQEAKKAIEDARKQIADVINANPEEIIFTSGGTESDNLALKGVAYANKDKGDHLITSKIEHPAILEVMKFLESKGFKVTYIDVDKDGIVNSKAVEKAITDKTILVSIMHVNNEVGTIQPIEEIGRICKEKNVLFHTDAVQSFGKIPIDVKSTNIDLLSISSHKIYGPTGTGCLYVKIGTNLEPLIHGGGHEKDIRSGTENVSGIVGFGKAAELSKETMKEEAERLIKLRDKLIENVLKIEKSHLTGHPEKRLSGNAHFWFDGIEGEALILMLNEKNIAASTGSACSSKKLEPSHVLLALGLKPEQSHGSLRMVLGRYTTEKDIDYVIETLPRVIKRLREISATWSK
jgi:cysteine desulfurase